MSISIKKYVDITSGVGGASAVKQRELILRLLTANPVVAAGTIVEVTSLTDVATMFGTDSEEYKRAAMYFGYTSKLITKANKLSFASLNDTPSTVPASITSGAAVQLNIANWQAISSGSLDFTIGGTTVTLTGLDFSAANSLSAVAAVLQTAIQTVVSGATVTFDTIAQKYVTTFDGVAVPAAFVLNVPASGTDLAPSLGWTAAQSPTVSEGSTASGALSSLIAADEISDNYGSFAFVDTVLTLDEVEEVASWNNAQNVKYQYLVPVTLANYAQWNAALLSYSGTALTLVADDNTEYDEQIPGVILGATNYNLRNASSNYMFQQVTGVSPKVDSSTLQGQIDQTRVNYYGRTKNAGQPIDFYQNGYLMGNANAPLQMNVYAGEQWFKAAAVTQLMDLFIALPIIPAADEGRAIVIAGLQDCIDRALFNKVILTGKTLDTTQKAYVMQITGDPRAWHQIQNLGYWLDAVITSEVQANGTTLYICDYTLLYAKGDAVNKITGRDILI